MPTVTPATPPTPKATSAKTQASQLFARENRIGTDQPKSATRSFRQTLQDAGRPKRTELRTPASGDEAEKQPTPGVDKDSEPTEKTGAADRSRRGSKNRMAGRDEATRKEEASADIQPTAVEGAEEVEVAAGVETEAATESTDDVIADGETQTDKHPASDDRHSAEALLHDVSCPLVQPVAAVANVEHPSELASYREAAEVATIETIDGASLESTAADAMAGLKEATGLSEAGVKGAAGDPTATRRPQLRPATDDLAQADEVAVQPSDDPNSAVKAIAPADVVDDASFVEAFADAFQTDHQVERAGGPAHHDTQRPEAAFQQPDKPTVAGGHAASKPEALPPVPSAPDFTAANHARIASSVKGELLPNGGTMQLRLDPPELGSLQVSLHLRDGVVTASFQTQNDEAARLLSHSLTDLRSSLESHGIVVDKLLVQQAPKEESSGNDPGAGRQTAAQQQDNRRDQQRKEMVQRLWDRLAGKEPLDLVA